MQLPRYQEFNFYNYTIFYIQYYNRPLEPKFADCINWQICVRFIELYIVTVQTSKRVAKLEFQQKLQILRRMSFVQEHYAGALIFVNKILYDLCTDTGFLEIKALASQNTRQSRVKLKTPETIQVHFVKTNFETRVDRNADLRLQGSFQVAIAYFQDAKYFSATALTRVTHLVLKASYFVSANSLRKFQAESFRMKPSRKSQSSTRNILFICRFTQAL
ncbi:Hypothetical_protein [Hexamita inflata]|uniref:Hypothetical_protein n=2 Tax=Hexamita inflata TaxID=28002 RepID=A0AA86TQX6_9EUKA|nr:Hypothetical protein HINF_LOCUS7452 [Hexamita inflata]CAI9925060.1 Hypothetical protein HINF_LOCUS12705 [Hexamita inflata]